MFDLRSRRRLLIAAGALALAIIACTAPAGGVTPSLPPAATATPPIPGPTDTPAAPVTAAAPATAAVTAPPAACDPATPDPSIPGGAGWLVYCGDPYPFGFRYPAGGVAAGGSAGHGHIYLPITPGTNLGEKYLDVTTTEGATTCQSPSAAGYAPGSIPSSTVTLNGYDFFKQSGSDAGAGNFYEWVGYSYLHDELCISLTFILHSYNPGNFPTPPPQYDQAAESAVFDQVVATFTIFGEAAVIPTVTGSAITSTDCTPPAPSGPDAALVGAIYCDTHYKFGFRYPPVGDSGYSGAGPLSLPIKTDGTNLADKTLQVAVTEGAATCASPEAAGYAPGSIASDSATFNGVPFVRQSSSSAGAGNQYLWVGYSTTRGGVCVSLTFILHSLNPGNFPTPPPVYDPAAESAMFQTIMSTFYWYGS